MRETISPAILANPFSFAMSSGVSSELIQDVPVCSTIKQEFHNFCVSPFGGLMQWRTTHVPDGVHIGAAWFTSVSGSQKSGRFSPL